jgi:hypothetical protein
MYYVVLSCQVFPSETIERYVQAHGLMRILFKQQASERCYVHQ